MDESSKASSSATTPGKSLDARSDRYGVNAMEQLINALLRLGARRGALVAKAFGGASNSPRLAPIGDGNAKFARGCTSGRRPHRAVHRYEPTVPVELLYRPNVTLF